jgi:predicted metal-binding membrane protein
MARELWGQLRTRDGAIALAAVATATLLASLYTVFGVGMQMSAIQMTGMARTLGNPMMMPPGSNWTILHGFLLFAMWWIMMIAMMAPSAAPTILLFTALKRKLGGGSVVNIAIWLFLAGYFVLWAGFSAIAVLLQWFLVQSDILAAGMMTVKGNIAAGAILVAAGLYQLTPLKRACLEQCKSPAQFLTLNYRAGLKGAFLMGTHHGVYCIGCCWALMTLLFVGGVMNLWWIVGLAALVAFEKFTGPSVILPRVIGSILIAAGGLVAFS